MGRKYATGKRSWAICDRCGQRYYRKDLKKEWTQLIVCQSCFEPKHPQLTPKIIADPQAIAEPRTEERAEITVLVSSTGGSAPWTHSDGEMFERT